MGLKKKFAQTKAEFEADIVNTLRQEPWLTYRQVALKVGTYREHVARIAAADGITRNPGPKPKKEK